MAENMADSGLAKKRRKIEIIANENALQENITRDVEKKLMAHCMKEMNEESLVTDACDKYKTLCMVPKINKGRIIECQNTGELDEYSLVSKCSQHDLENKEMKRWEQSMKVKIDWKRNSISLDAAPFPSTLQDIILQTVSHDAMFQGIIKKSTKKDKTSFILEVWSRAALYKVINLSAYEKHGDIYSDATFSSLQWSHDCIKLMYIAEKKREHSDSYFDLRKDSAAGKIDEEGSKIVDKLHNETMNVKVIKYNGSGQLLTISGEKYLCKEDWGEQEVGLCHPVIIMIDIVSEKMEVLNCIPNDISPGQCLWGPDNSIIFIGWWHNPFRLGVIYCENRRSAIFQVKFGENGASCCQLSNDHCSVQSPRLSPGHSNLIYLERNAGGTHRGCERLMMLDLSSQSTSSKLSSKVIYGIVEIASESCIPIFCQSLPRRCWIKNGEYIALQTNFRSDKVIVVIEIKTGGLYRVTHEAGSWSLLDIHKNILLASYAAPNAPDTLIIGKFEPGQRKVNWIKIESDPYNMESILKWEKLVVSHDNELPENRTESVLITPMNASSKIPLIVWPHGGPHTCAIADFLLYPALFASLGFAVLLVNYRGSTGFGEKPLKSLLGKIATQDVGDVQLIAQTAIKTKGFDDKNVFIFGGSHGGFLSAHLIGQFPDSYKACVLRNPVINIPSMVEVTDIPDWCYVESGLEYCHEIYPNKETYCSMLDKSPISFSKNVTCPVMVMIGGKDVRVPLSQGRSFYRNLKANGKEARIHLYPDDSHPLNEVETEADVFVNISRWFYKYLDQ